MYIYLEGVVLKISRISIIAIMLVVIAVAIAGCSSTSPTVPATTVTTTKATTAAATTTTVAPSGTTSAPAAGSVVGGAAIFGSSPASYNWIEYKMSSGGMTVFMKIDKVKGTCIMRFEGGQVQGMPTEIACGSAGGPAQQNPNDIKSDVQFTFVGIEPVSVPAGTYPAASKYTSTYQGITATFWTAPGVPGFVKMVSGDATMELNGWG